MDLRLHHAWELHFRIGGEGALCNAFGGVLKLVFRVFPSLADFLVFGAYTLGRHRPTFSLTESFLTLLYGLYPLCFSQSIVFSRPIALCSCSSPASSTEASLVPPLPLHPFDIELFLFCAGAAPGASAVWLGIWRSAPALLPDRVLGRARLVRKLAHSFAITSF